MMRVIIYPVLIALLRTALARKVSPLHLLCFAMEHPAERAFCLNKANSTCLEQRMAPYMPFIPKNPYCKTDAVATVDMPLLKSYMKSKCSNSKKKSRHNNVWIATQVKNDAQTILEWLVWHFLAGVEHALIYEQRIQ